MHDRAKSLIIGAERAVINARYGIAHKLGLALYIGFLRLSGRSLKSIRKVPAGLWTHLGRAVHGWHGAEYAQSSRTPTLLAEQGIRYMLDWPHDERVVPMRTDAGTILSLPMSADLDDVMAHGHRKVSMPRWVRSVSDAVDRLCMDGRSGGRLLVVNLHPWLMGQPYRSSYLAELLATLRLRDDVWFTTTDQIAAHAAPLQVTPA